MLIKRISGNLVVAFTFVALGLYVAFWPIVYVILIGAAIHFALKFW